MGIGERCQPFQKCQKAGKKTNPGCRACRHTDRKGSARLAILRGYRFAAAAECAALEFSTCIKGKNSHDSSSGQLVGQNGRMQGSRGAYNSKQMRGLDHWEEWFHNQIYGADVQGDGSAFIPNRVRSWQTGTGETGKIIH